MQNQKKLCFARCEIFTNQFGKNGRLKLTGAMAVHEKLGSSGHVRLLRQRG
jgi:hypothetical protein